MASVDLDVTLVSIGGIELESVCPTQVDYGVLSFQYCNTCCVDIELVILSSPICS